MLLLRCAWLHASLRLAVLTHQASAELPRVQRTYFARDPHNSLGYMQMGFPIGTGWKLPCDLRAEWRQKITFPINQAWNIYDEG